MRASVDLCRVLEKSGRIEHEPIKGVEFLDVTRLIYM